MQKAPHTLFAQTPWKVFDKTFFKKFSQVEGAKPSSRSAERETPDRSQAPEGVNFFRRKKEGKPQVGFPLLSLTRANSSATFSFDTKGAKEKVIKKKTPFGEFRRLRAARRPPRPPPARAFEKARPKLLPKVCANKCEQRGNPTWFPLSFRSHESAYSSVP